MAFKLDLTSLSLSRDAASQSAFELKVSKADWRGLLKHGTWWILPFGRRQDALYGIRILPGRELSECPVVAVEKHQAITVVSRPAHLVPWLIFPGTVVARDGWDSVLRMGEPIWDELAGLHGQMGGTDGLAAIRAVLNDDALAEACLIGKAGDQFDRAYPEIKSRLDPTPESQAYFALLKRAVVDMEAEAPIPEVGCWQAAASSAVLSAARLRKKAELAREAAWQLMRQPSGLDCFQARYPSLPAHPSGSSEQMISAARSLIDDPAVPAGWRADPWWQAVAALAKDGDEYGGVEHMDAARDLQAAGRAEEAFYALTSSAYWFSQMTKKPNPKLHEAAQLLVAEAGWPMTEDALVAVAEGING
jgi:hypothetical protein